MDSTGKHEAHDRLMADIRLSQERLERFTGRLAEMAEDAVSAYRKQAESLKARSLALKARVADWQEVEIGLPTAVADLGAAVDTLEADAEAATESEPSAYQEILDRQARAWRARLDQLRVQSSLGAMEVREELDSLSRRLDRARGGALVELQNAVGDTKGLVVDLRKDVEEVLVDVRHAVERAVSAMTGK